MKSRSLLFAMVLAVVGTFQVAAQSVQEKVPFTLSGIWQMCFYRSSQPGIPGELKTGNTLKILSDVGRFSNVVMMPTGAIVIGYGTYTIDSDSTYTENVEKNIHLPQLNNQKNVLHYTLKDQNKVMVLKYFLKDDIDGNRIDSCCYETWKRVDMPSKYPENIVR